MELEDLSETGSAQIVMIFESLMMAASAAHHYLVRSTLKRRLSG